MAASPNKPTEPRSKYYWILTAVCLLLGLPAAWWLYIEIGKHISRIPIAILLLPLLLLLLLARVIDAGILKAAPQLVRKRDRAALTAALGYDPVTRQPVASAVGTAPATVGYSQPGSPQPQPGQPGTAAPYGQPGQAPTSYGN
ncbi:MULTISPECIES: hypothetical protein [Actinomyces]|uniref:Uncharacterized protein n=1 Tax=Actinomyces respiraculi TaxID=2744574 RepID=A0A7T0LJU9_9ACTO|nr:MULTISPECIES: hypothetical protein [Actinomyces]QPL05092.1 hypothetical protein ID810_10175 [Actinomyces respiraculi]